MNLIFLTLAIIVCLIFCALIIVLYKHSNKKNVCTAKVFKYEGYDKAAEERRRNELKKLREISNKKVEEEALLKKQQEEENRKIEEELALRQKRKEEEKVWGPVFHNFCSGISIKELIVACYFTEKEVKQLIFSRLMYDPWSFAIRNRVMDIIMCYIEDKKTYDVEKIKRHFRDQYTLFEIKLAVTYCRYYEMSFVQESIWQTKDPEEKKTLNAKLASLNYVPILEQIEEDTFDEQFNAWKTDLMQDEGISRDSLLSILIHDTHVEPVELSEFQSVIDEMPFEGKHQFVIENKTELKSLLMLDDAVTKGGDEVKEDVQVFEGDNEETGDIIDELIDRGISEEYILERTINDLDEVRSVIQEIYENGNDELFYELYNEGDSDPYDDDECDPYDDDDYDVPENEYQVLFDSLSSEDKRLFVQNNKSLIENILSGADSVRDRWKPYSTSALLDELKKRNDTEIVYAMDDSDAVREWLEKELQD